MATTASAPQQAASSAYASSHPQYYATNQQSYQPAAYSYAAWPAQQPTYSAAPPYGARPDDSNPPVPGTEIQSVSDSSAGQQQTHSPYSQDQAAHDAQQQWYKYCHEYYNYYGQWPPQQQQQQQQYNYTAPQPQASAAPWAPVSAPQPPVVLPAPSQQPAAVTQIPAAASYARQPTSHTKAAAATQGYKVMPNGSFKPISKGDEPVKPALIKPNVPKKKPGVMQPAYTKVAEVKKPEPAAAVPAGDFPPSLHSFVQRCFIDPAAGSDKTALQAKLKEMIADARAKGEMWTRDWDKVPFPASVTAAAKPAHVVKAPAGTGRASRWGQQAKPAKQSCVLAPVSPASSLSSRSTRRSYSSDSRSSSRSRSRSRSLASRFTSRSRSRSSSRSPSSLYRGGKGGSNRKRPTSMKSSPGGSQGKAKKMKQAGPPETKKQRKQRLQAERNAAHQRVQQQAAASAKKARKQQQTQQDTDGPPPTPEELHRRNMRAGRFGSGAVDQSAPVHIHAPVYAAALSRERHVEGADCEAKWDQHAVQGTCSNLEKKYFRLTGPPDPSAVRSPHILKAALDRMVRIYRAGQCDIHYAEDQLKAMRQDVTVQHVRGVLPVQIYEAHARACLEHGNGGDFNQCQAQLTVLYEEGSPGCLHEFVAYRVLYQSILRSKESASLLATLEQLSPQVCAHPAVAHALKVRQALVFSRFTAFFHLYASAPNLGRALMDMCFSRVRFAALETLVDAFKNTKEQQSTQALHNLEVQHSQNDEQDGALRLPGCAKPNYMGKHPAEVDGERAAEAAVQWLRSCNAIVVLEQGAHPSTALLDCKSSIRLSMPEDVTAVAHGDATLNLHSFMHPVRVN
ncbi:hypothetical protein WJX77_010828 [Trebouxia sp. C0004]